jgi:hypothetical protein
VNEESGQQLLIQLTIQSTSSSCLSEVILIKTSLKHKVRRLKTNVCFQISSYNAQLPACEIAQLLLCQQTETLCFENWYSIGVIIWEWDMGYGKNNETQMKKGCATF